MCQPAGKYFHPMERQETLVAMQEIGVCNFSYGCCLVTAVYILSTHQPTIIVQSVHMTTQFLESACLPRLVQIVCTLQQKKGNRELLLMTLDDR